MKATGIVRRIDDLGRIVIPKEIRRTMHIREGDPLEIFVGSGEIVFKKYSLIGDASVCFAMRFAVSFVSFNSVSVGLPCVSLVNTMIEPSMSPRLRIGMTISAVFSKPSRG